MRSNSPSYTERRSRRISGNMNRNSFDLLSTIINYENNQRYPMRNSNADRTNLRAPRRVDQEDQEAYYDENLPPPDYDSICPQKTEIIRDELKGVIVDQTVVANMDNNYLNNQLNSQLNDHLNNESLELKNLNMIRNDDQVNNNQCANQLENQSTSGESTSNENQEMNQEISSNVDERQSTDRNQTNISNSQPNSNTDQDYRLPTYEQAVTLSKQNRV